MSVEHHGREAGRGSPSIGIVLPTYNGSAYLREQLESIQAQSRVPDEIVVSDDGSSDLTVDIARSVGASTPTPLHLIAGDHVGLRRNVGRALEASRADVLVFADQDDMWAPGKLEAVAAAFSDPAVTLWFSDAALVDAQGRSLDRSAWQSAALDDGVRATIDSGAGLSRLIHGQTVTGATMAVRRSVLELALPLPRELDTPDHLMLHDGWLALLASLLGTTVTDSRQFTLYRQHAGQITGMAMAATPTNGQPGRTTRGARRAQLSVDQRRVQLVLDRLRSHGVLDRCRPQDIDWLESAEAFYGARTTPAGAARLQAIARQVLVGGYQRFARGWRTAISDLVTFPRET